MNKTSAIKANKPKATPMPIPIPWLFSSVFESIVVGTGVDGSVGAVVVGDWVGGFIGGIWQF